MLSQQSDGLRPQLDRFQRIALIVGIVGAVGCLAGAFIQPVQFFQSYLFGFIFWFGLTLGGMAATMLQHLVGGAWGASIRRVLEANASQVPLVAALFVPILVGMWLGDLYPWTRPEVAAEPAVVAKTIGDIHYLDPLWFTVRAVMYFVIWAGMAYVLNKRSLEQDRTRDERIAPWLRSFSGPGMVIYFLTVTLAAVDWGMSLEPDWYSSMYGVIYIIGQGLSTWAFTIVVMHLLRGYEPIKTVMNRQRFQDVGNLMFAFTILWAYVQFSQYLIIWSGNIAEETPFYAHRSNGGWEYFAIALMLCQFFLPFFILMVRAVKRNSNMLLRVALFVIAVRFIDLFWLIKPSFYPDGVQIDWTDIVAPIAIGGIWLAGFIQVLKSRPLVPQFAPVLLRRLDLERHEEEKHEELFGHLHH